MAAVADGSLVTAVVSARVVAGRSVPLEQLEMAYCSWITTKTPILIARGRALCTVEVQNRPKQRTW